MKIKEEMNKLNSKIETLQNWFMAHPFPGELSEEDVHRIYDDLWDIRTLSNSLNDKF